MNKSIANSSVGALLALTGIFVPSAALVAFFRSDPGELAESLLAGAGLSLLFAVGKHDRIAAVLLWYLWASLFGRNPGSAMCDASAPHYGRGIFALAPLCAPILRRPRRPSCAQSSLRPSEMYHLLSDLKMPFSRSDALKRRARLASPLSTSR